MAKYKLEEICEIITDGTHKTPEYCEEGGFKFLSSKDVTSRKIDWNNVKYIPEKLHNELYSRLAPRKNDILLAKNGTTGVAALVDRDEIFDIYVSLALLRPKKEIYPQYLLYGINSPTAKKQFNAGIKGIGVPNLHLGVIRKTEIDVPDIEIQIEICKNLEVLESVIEKRNQELEALDNLIKARFVELFGDPISNPFGWKKQRFDTLCENLDARRKPITASEREEGIYPYYGASGIVDHVAGYIFDEDILLVSEDGANLLMRSTPIAFSVCGKVWVNNHAHVVRFEKMSMQKYIEVYFSMIDISEQITGSAQPKLNQAKLNAMMFCVPDESRLEEFLVFIKQVDKSKLQIQKSLNETQLLFDSLMQKYFG